MALADEIQDRRIFGGSADVIKLHPIKYQFAMDAYRTGNANHWLPQEIQMQKDIEQWSKLTEGERHVIETALGFFTTADSLVANNLVLGIYKHLSAPECRMYLLRQAFEEAVHTESYQHIVQSLGLDEEVIFQKYKDIEEIYNKDGFVTKVSNRVQEATIDIYQFAEVIFDFYIVMEGIFFYSSFAAIMNFRRRNLLPGTAEQFQYIMRDEAMHLQFGTNLLNALVQENPRLDLLKNFKYKVKKAVELEQEYARTMLDQGLLGISTETYCQYVEFIADRRLQSIGLNPRYNVVNPFPWMSEITDLTKQKNFFETRVTEYQQGALKW